VAFAVYIYGDSMAPRFEPGNLLYIDPTKPVNSGAYVIVELKNQTGIVGRYVSSDGKQVVLDQLIPTQRHQFERDVIVTMSRVVAVGEL
jgi:phage repressor protein C with HTH and peptisase S24 domain